MKHIFMWVTLALCFLFSNSKPLTSENVVIAIDCGSNMDYQSPDGFTYVAVIIFPYQRILTIVVILVLLITRSIMCSKIIH